MGREEEEAGEEGGEEAQGEEGQEGQEAQGQEEEKEEEGEEEEEERKKKKAKKVRFVGGKRRKGQHKSKAMIAAGKKNAAAQKKKGTGLFKPVTCSAALSKITGISGKATRGTITKAVWAYIKKKGLSKGRNVGKIDGIFGGGSMFKLTSAVSKHISERMRFPFPSDLNAWEQGVLRPAV